MHASVFGTIHPEATGYLLERMEQDSIAYTPESLDRNRKTFNVSLKALLARYLWGLDAYFKINNTENPIVQKGLEVLTDDKLYNQVFRKTKP